MKIQIDAKPLGPLSVLSELPDARLAVIEGLNGIGKTLAVRLLSICTTGIPPYRPDSPAWSSFCHGLGAFQVRVSGLRHDKSIEWTADTRDWTGTSNVADLFQQILVDGRPSTIHEVRKHFVVHRLAGDETLIETLAQQADGAEALLSRWLGAAAAPSNSPLSRIEAEAAHAIRSFGETSLERYELIVAELERTQEEVAAAKARAQEATVRARVLSEAIALQTSIEELRTTAPALQGRLKEVEDGIVETRRTQEQLQEEIVRLAGHAAKHEPVVRELRNAQRTLQRNQLSLSAAVNAARATAARLQMDKATVSRIKEHEMELDETIALLTRRQVEMDASPTLRALLDELLSTLSQGESRGLGGQVALDDPETDLQLTVEQTRSGMSERRRQLEGQPPAPEAKEVNDSLANLRDRQQALSTLTDELRQVERFMRLVTTNQARVDAALQASNPKATNQLRDLEHQRRKLDADILELAAERAVLTQRLGSLARESLGEVQHRLRATLTQLGTAQSVTSADLHAAHRDQTSTNQHLEERGQRLVALRREVARVHAEAKRTLRAFADGGDAAWLRSALFEDRFPPGDSEITAALSSLDSARAKVTSVTERLGAHRNQLMAIAQALRDIGRHLRDQESEAEASEYVPQLEEWFSGTVSQWFNSDRVRSELLPEADAQITVDVHGREVRWTEQGKDRSRPLEAFSSGEQAFAYTRARLADIDSSDSAECDRLVVLDEFGAFIAHDRLTDLMTYLHSWVARHRQDQVLVILPLTRDYDADARAALSPSKRVLEELAQQVASRRFAVRVLDR